MFSLLPNDVKLRINMINQMDTYFVMEKNKAISAVENATKTLHIQKNMHLIYKQDYYEDKLKEIDDIFIEYLAPIMENLDRLDLIEK